MSIRIPANIIIESKYTIGGEYVLKTTYEDYQGYYYTFNGKTFAGEKFALKAPVLIKKEVKEENALLASSDSTVNAYGKLIKSSPLLAKPPKPLSNTLNVPSDDSTYMAYFYRTVLENKNILIKEIDEDTYKKYKDNPLYIVASARLDLGDAGITNEELSKIEKIIPEFREWFFSDSPYFS
jgi:hypothetical protein